jgi:NNP family nitrate/nitrite transporter-like MFS transporter
MTHARTTPHQSVPPQSSERQSSERGATPWVMLALATLGFAVNFWAWALISPLGPMFRDLGTLGDLTESDVALLVAVPVIVG